MSEGKRPGGLTALAVLNFVFGGFGVLGVFGMVAVMALMNMAVDASAEASSPERDEAVKAWREIGTPALVAMIAAMAVSATLLIASGVGYLQQKKFLGRTLGNVYAVLSIAVAIVSALMLHEKAGGGFNLGTLIGLVYPVLTLILLNGTFKHDFIR